MSLQANFEIVGEKSLSKTAQKKSRNSKRRKAKKLKDDQNSKIEEIVQLLSQSITNNQPGTSRINSSVATKNVSAVKKKKASQSVKVNNEKNSSIQATCKNIPSPSKYLADMFQNLQLNSQKNSVKSNIKMKFSKTDSFNQAAGNVVSCQKSSKMCKRYMFIRPKVPKQKDNSSNGTQNPNKTSGNKNKNKNKNKKKNKNKNKKKKATGNILLNTYIEESVNLIEIKELNDTSKKNKKTEIVIDTKHKNKSGNSKVVNEQKNMIRITSKLTFDDVEKSLKKYQKAKKLLEIEKARHLECIQRKLCIESMMFNENQNVLLNSFFKGPFQNLGGSPCCCNLNSHANSTKSTKQEVGENRTTKPPTEFPKYFTQEEMQGIKDVKLYTGIIRINQKNYQEAYIQAPDKGSDIVIVGLLERNRALEGDEVYYFIKSREHFRINTETKELQRTAVVVAIKSLNHSRSAVGTLNASSKCSTYAVFSPRDSRVPRIRIKKQNWPLGFAENPELFKNKILYAKITNWTDIRYAEGEIIKEVGIIGDIEAETSAIMLMNDLDENEYSDSLKNFMPRTPYVISKEEYSRRLDFRKECIFTIDPATAKDLDDAVSFKLLPNGNYQIGVHISDVTYFLQDGSPLDKAVCNRANSVYLVQKVYHMLPKELCELCSLTPGEDKLSFSVVWEMTPEPEFAIINKFFTRSIINSCGQFSYDQIQSILDGTNPLSVPEIQGDHSLSEIEKAVTYLNKVAVHLRQMRFSNGALKIDQTKIIFSLDEFSLPLDFSVYENKSAHQLIEELMLLANVSVAEKINLRFPKTAFLRSHSPPMPYIMKKTQSHLAKCGLFLDISSSRSINSFLVKYSGTDPESVAKTMVLNTLLAKPMSRAKYYCSDKHRNSEEKRHYALNIPIYTHFTSPIRRYADIIVHRLLAASLGYRSNPKLSVEKMQNIADNCNKQKYAAKMASDKSIELYFAIYTMLKGPFICNAVVCDVKDKSFDCITLSSGLHYRIYYQNINAKPLVIKDDGIYKLTLIWPKNDDEEELKQNIEIFSIIRIELKNSKELKVKATLLKGNNI